MKYLAHIAEDGTEQTVREHLEGTAKLASQFAAEFDAESQGELAGMYHDIGKYTDKFQKRLHGGKERVDHATAGARECLKQKQPYAALAISGHHGGLPNGGGKADIAGQGTFLGRMKKSLPDYSAFSNLKEISENFPIHAVLPKFLMERPDPLKQAFFTRMLFSCLTDADFLDTEAFMEGERETLQWDMKQLDEILCQHTERWFPPKNELNTLRCEILRSCQKHGEQDSSGLFTLTVPTGGGKTIASLSFALKHAVQHNKKRIIYVIPYTSIIEQTAETFRDILGEEYVLEHHSNVEYSDHESAESYLDKKLLQKSKATENWDMPIVVTTAVQFFESLYSNKTSKCRKLHNLANSIIIFDEAQMLPIPYLRPCVYAITQLVQNYKVSAVLCTATQPALEDIISSFWKYVYITELCPKDIAGNTIFRRTTFESIGKCSWEGLCEQLNEQEQVLCIVNSRKNAETVYQGLCGKGIYHLSTLMHPKHRKKVLDTIRQRLKDGLPCKVVSTSLIEAGVDVDFPCVYRELAGLDSILQAAGRCNREGKRNTGQSKVFIFESENSAPPMFGMQIGATRAVMRYYEDFSTEQAIHAYFDELFTLKGEENLDKKHILKRLQRENFPFEDVAKDFKLIETDTRTVYILGEDENELRQQLLEGVHNRQLLRKASQYSVAVYPQHFQALYDAGDIELIEEESAVLNNLTLYSEDTGLSLEADYGKGWFI